MVCSGRRWSVSADPRTLDRPFPSKSHRSISRESVVLPSCLRTHLIAPDLRICLQQCRSAVDTAGMINVDALDTTICNIYSCIPFMDWVNACAGLRSERIDSLLMAIALFRHEVKSMALCQLSSHRFTSSDFDGQSELHPLTQGALNFPRSSDLPMEMLDTILRPIRDTILDVDTESVFMRIMILGVRYNHTFIEPEAVNWSRQLSLDFTFSDALIHEDLQWLALAITEADIELLTRTTILDLFSEASDICDGRWLWLCRQAYECAVVSVVLLKKIYQLASILFHIRNYHSMTALVSGVQKAITHKRFRKKNGKDPLNYTSAYYRYLEPYNNFEFCRQQSMAAEALPWLLPFRQHLRTARTLNCGGEVVLCSANILLQIMTFSIK